MIRRVVLCAASIALVLSAAEASIVRIPVDDMIHPITDEFIDRGLARAETMGADAVVIELSTPGGLDESTRKIVERIFRSRVPVIVYVYPSGARAASAGFFILQAADIAAMAPGTNTGAAHPVVLGEKLDEVMKMKLQNDAAAFMRTIAQRRGRNVAVAESAVREAKSFTEQEALQQKVIDVVAPDLRSLLRAVEGRQVTRFDGQVVTLRVSDSEIHSMEMTLRQRLLSWIMNPNVAFILMSLGMLALWAEFNHPGAILPGVVGLIAILLAVFALNLLPTRFAAIALILVAFGLFALEAKYTAYGIFGIGGVICMIFGALLLVDGPIPEMRVNLVTALVVSIPIGAIAIFLMTLVMRAHKGRIETGTEGMIGEIGIARTDLSPDGKVFVHGELWNA
ncbi:MAG TPA: nodulation protein NfeD, partial [Thermoanaerobaculia bacterium]|nr:nodulation protein NfeD [Thermoanaerobaculia bacterium]